MILLVILSEPQCEGISVIVKSGTPESDYNMSMTAEDSGGSCGSFDFNDLKKMLLGSREMWRCKEEIPRTLVIEPNVECDGAEWSVQYLTFKVKSVKKVEIYVDGKKILEVSCGVSVVFLLFYTGLSNSHKRSVRSRGLPPPDSGEATVFLAKQAIVSYIYCA